MNILTVFVTLFMLIFADSIQSAEQPLMDGLSIVKEAKSRDTGWVSSSVDVQMILVDDKGGSVSRQLNVSTLEVLDSGDKNLTIFRHPIDVKGTAFLIHSQVINPDKQWLFLPALKRVKRISSSNKSGAFMGSEFAFEDLSSFEVEKFKYKYIKDEVIDGIECYVIEYVPIYKYSGYTSLISWIDKSNYNTQKIDYYDRKQALLKTVKYTNYKKYSNGFWRAHKTSMFNHQTAKRTDLIWGSYNFNTKLTDRDFHKANLARQK